MAATRMHIDPDIGIPDLVRSLKDDSTRLVRDEIRLGKLELHDDVKRAGHGSLWLGASFAVGIVTLVLGTFAIATLIGRLAAGHMWVGAVVVGVVELALGIVLIKRGRTVFGEPSYSLEQTRAGLGR
ncbi:MAG TPA: phage holin family protein [Gemmatimonadaceae bacterium]|jgi:hypothetical protein